MDNLTKEQRKKNMSAIRSKGNKSTEEKFIKFLRDNKITGWRRNYKLYGSPDIVILKRKIAIFLDGCFWHGCKKHFKSPKSNQKYWTKKIKRNLERDKQVNQILEEKAWKVIRIWEHNIKRYEFDYVLKYLKSF